MRIGCTDLKRRYSRLEVVSTGTLVPADALNRLTRNLTIELEELVGNCSQDFDLTETTC